MKRQWTVTLAVLEIGWCEPFMSNYPLLMVQVGSAAVGGEEQDKDQVDRHQCEHDDESFLKAGPGFV